MKTIDVYYINLKSAFRRRRILETALSVAIRHAANTIHVRIHRIEAINGHDKKMHTNGLIRVPKTVIGCAESHRTIWQRLGQQHGDSANEYSIILEDDATIPAHFFVYVAYLLSKMPDGADMVYLGYFGFPVLHIPKHATPFMPAFLPFGLHAYIITHRHAAYLYESTRTIRFHLDWMVIYYNAGKRVYVTSQNVLQHIKLNESSIANLQGNVPFPMLINRILQTYQDKYNNDLAYYANVPMFETWLGTDISFITLTTFALGLMHRKSIACVYAMYVVLEILANRKEWKRILSQSVYFLFGYLIVEITKKVNNKYVACNRRSKPAAAGI